MSAVTARGVSYSYGRTQVLHEVDLDVEEGKTFALVGPNGGGKSTLLSLLSTTRRLTKGTLQVLGMALPAQREQVRGLLATVFQSPAVDGLLTVRENLSLHARLFSRTSSTVDDALQRMSLADLADRRVHQLSGGQKRRVELAKALLQKPRLLLLDEPGTGLDPAVKQAFWQAIGEYQKSTGATVVVATHDDFETAQSHDLAFVVQGRVTQHGRTAELMAKHAKPVVEVVRHPTLSEIFKQVTGEALTEQA